MYNSIQHFNEFGTIKQEEKLGNYAGRLLTKTKSI